MATFVVLGTLTDRAAQEPGAFATGFQENLSRAEHFGITARGFYITQGHYDFVVVAEAQNAEAVLGQAIGVARGGNVRTETMRAYTLDEFKQVMQRTA